MAYVSLQLPPGIERNNTPYDTTGQWWDMNLVRWQSGSIKPVGGWTRTTSSPLDSAVRKFHLWRDNSEVKHALVGTDARLYYEAGGSYSNITPASFVPLTSTGTGGGFGTSTYSLSTYGTARPTPSLDFSVPTYWTFANWGQDIILTANTDGRLFYYSVSSPSTAPAVITTAPTGCHSVLVTDERHAMVFGYGTGGSDNSRTVAWSSREDYTDWNFSSTTNTAGYQALTARSALLKGVKVKEGVLVFGYSDVFLAQYVGQPFIYGFQRISDTEMMHPDNIATFNGKAVWLSRSGFQLYSGGFVQPLPCPILNDIFDEMDPYAGPTRIHSSHHGLYPEIWWFYPTTGNSEANRYIIWNYAENWWGWGYLSRSAMFPAEVFRLPYMGSPAGNIYQHEDGWTDVGNPRYSQIFAETGAIGIGNGDQFVEVTQGLIATGNGYNKLSATFYGRAAPEGSERTFGPYSIRSDGYTDTRVTAREARIRFQATQDGDWGFGKVRLDVTSSGKR